MRKGLETRLVCFGVATQVLHKMGLSFIFVLSFTAPARTLTHIDHNDIGARIVVTCREKSHPPPYGHRPKTRDTVRARAREGSPYGS